jgi:thymidylate kinase
MRSALIANRTACTRRDDLFTVALVGADGAGKTTLTHSLVDTLPLPVKYVYMGINLESSNLVLPTTRLVLEIKRLRGKRPDMRGPFDPSARKPIPKGLLKRTSVSLKSSLRALNTLAEEWFRQAVVAAYRRRGFIVIFDRHFLFDYYFHHILHKDKLLPAADQLHGYILERFYPRPDLVICLDAPAEVLHARKAEASPTLLEKRRQEYLQLGDIVEDFVVVDASRPQEQVLKDVRDLICDYSRVWQGKNPSWQGFHKKGRL